MLILQQANFFIRRKLFCLYLLFEALPLHLCIGHISLQAVDSGISFNGHYLVLLNVFSKIYVSIKLNFILFGVKCFLCGRKSMSICWLSWHNSSFLTTFLTVNVRKENRNLVILIPMRWIPSDDQRSFLIPKVLELLNHNS